MRQKGAVSIFIPVGLAIVALGIILVLVVSTREAAENKELNVASSPIITSTPTAKPTPAIASTPKPTLKPTAKLVATTTGTQTPTPATPTQPECSAYKFEEPTGAIKVVITSKTHYDITWKQVEIYAHSGCKALNNKSLDKYDTSAYGDNVEVSFGQVVAGPYSIRVRYSDGKWTGIYNTDVIPGQLVTLNIEIP